MAGVKVVHVPYKGGGARARGLLGGQVQLMFSTMAARAAAREGREAAPPRGTSAKRSPRAGIADGR